MVNRVPDGAQEVENVSIVQWIEYRIPVPTIRVRLPMEIPETKFAFVVLIIMKANFVLMGNELKLSLRTPERRN